MATILDQYRNIPFDPFKWYDQSPVETSWDNDAGVYRQYNPAGWFFSDAAMASLGPGNPLLNPDNFEVVDRAADGSYTVKVKSGDKEGTLYRLAPDGNGYVNQGPIGTQYWDTNGGFMDYAGFAVPLLALGAAYAAPYLAGAGGAAGSGAAGAASLGAATEPVASLALGGAGAGAAAAGSTGGGLGSLGGLFSGLTSSGAGNMTWASLLKDYGPLALSAINAFKSSPDQVTTTQQQQIDPRLAAMFYGYSGPEGSFPGLNSFALETFMRNQQQPDAAGRVTELADRAAQGYRPNVAGADRYTAYGRDIAPRTTAANTGYQSMFNPYIAGTEAALTQNAIDYLQRGLLPNIRDSAIAAGGYGGDRQGLAEGLAAGETAKGLLAQMANLRQQGFESDQSRTLQNAITNAGFRQQAGLANQQAGLAGMGYGLQARGQDIGMGADAARINQAGASNAANLYLQAAQFGQSSPWNALNQYTNVLSRFPGNTTGTSSTPVYTDRVGNALSGYLAGQALFGGNRGSTGGSYGGWQNPYAGYWLNPEG